MKKLSLPKVTLPRIRKFFFYAFFAVVLAGGGYYLGLRRATISLTGYPKVTISRELPQNHKDIEFSLFWKVWDTMSASYFDKTKLIPSKMVYGAIQGMVAAIGDPYTAFFPPDQNKVVQEDLKGGLEGVGIQIGFKGTQLAVIAPLPGTPAERAGIKAGDFIVGIKDDAKKVDHGTAGISLPEAVGEIRGEAGSVVTLTILRDGEDKPLFFDLTREKINVPSVITTFENGVAHIKLLKFAEDTNAEWEKAVAEINTKCHSQGTMCKGIVLDLRNNPGGYLQSSVDIASDFLTSNSVVVIEQDSSEKKSEFRTSKNPRLSEYRLVVLINAGSASASEILAGALRDQRGIKLVGEVSFGKGTIQEPDEFPDGAGLHITIAKWLTPNGTWVHGKGLTPDVKVLDDEKTTEDEQFLEAVKLLTF